MMIPKVILMDDDKNASARFASKVPLQLLLPRAGCEFHFGELAPKFWPNCIPTQASAILLRTIFGLVAMLRPQQDIGYSRSKFLLETSDATTCNHLVAHFKNDNLVRAASFNQIDQMVLCNQ